MSPSRSPVTRAELALLAAMLFLLPLFEVPKNLAWGAWLVVSVRSGWREGDFARGAWRWRGWDGVFAAMLLASVAAGLGEPAFGRSVSASSDMFRMVSVAWVMSRRGYGAREAPWLIGAVVGGTLVAALWGFVRLYTASGLVFLELNSVGHVNHSSIYLAIAFGWALSLAWLGSPERRGFTLAGGLGAVAIAVSLIVASSRASVGAWAVFVILLAWFAPIGGADPRVATRLRRRSRVALMVIVLAAAGSYRIATEVSVKRLQPEGQSLLEKFGFQASVGAPTSHRDGLLRLAWEAAKARPVFGLGNGGFRALTPRRVCEEFVRQPDCDPGRYFFSEHAHSLYAHSLAERGLVGFAALLALLGGWAVLLRRRLDWARADRRHAAVWIAALAGWSVTAFAGLLNTTLHHEHGLLAVSSLGLLLGSLQRE